MINETELIKYDLGRFGIVDYVQWLNPTSMHYYEHFTERDVMALRRYVKPGDMAIDIGANVGYTMLPIALAVSPGGTVLAFEPCPKTFSVLEENAKANKHLCTIRVFNKAVTETPGKFIFHYSKSFHNGAISKNFVDEGDIGADEHRLELDGVELKSFLEAEGIKLSRVSFVKIDTEGYDRKIIKSIDWLINEFKPVVKAEYLTCLSPSEKAELFDAVRSLDYKIFWELPDNKYVVEGSEINDIVEFSKRSFHCNMLCFSKGGKK